jgi:hypothetical protein
MDRFNSTVRFSYDYFSNRLRVNSSLQKIPFDLAYGAEAHSAAMIEALSLRLCDGVFKDEKAQRNVIVVSVERNMDDTLREKRRSISSSLDRLRGCLILMDLFLQNGTEHIWKNAR